MKPSFVFASLLPYTASSLVLPRNNNSTANTTDSNSFRGPTIESTSSTPLTDLAKISNGEYLVGTNGAYPRLSWRSDGILIGSYTEFSGMENILRVVQATDMGTFKSLGSIARGTGDLDNCFLLEVPLSSYPSLMDLGIRLMGVDATPTTGLLAAFRNHDKDAAGAYTYYRITLCISYDGGSTWQFLTNPVEAAPADDMLGYWEPFLRIGAQNEIQLSYSKTEAPDNQETFRSLSYDGGSTWTAPQCLVCHAADERKRDGMQSIVSVADQATEEKALIIVYETNVDGYFFVQAAVSYDDGASWGKRQTVYKPAHGYNAGAPQISAFKDGGLTVIFMTDENVSMVNWPSDAAIKAVASVGLRNGNLVFTQPATVSEAASNWPGSLSVSDTQVLGVFGTGGNLVGKVITQK